MTSATLDDIAALQDNWDGYGASSVPSSIIESCRALLPLLRAGYEIAPVPNGVVAVEWETEAGRACLEVGLTRYSMYIKRDAGYTMTSSGPVDHLKVALSRYMVQLGVLLYGETEPDDDAEEDDE